MKKYLTANSDLPNYKTMSSKLEAYADKIDNIASSLESKDIINNIDEFNNDLGDKYTDTVGENLGDSIYAVQQTLRESAETLRTIAFDISEEARMDGR